MMSPRVEKFRRVLHAHLPALKTDYAVASLELFGSYLRGEERTDSDLDVLVTYCSTPSLFRIIELENHLSDLLGVKVDLVLRDSLKPRIGDRILAEASPV